MIDTYFAKPPELMIKIPSAFDPKIVKAALAEIETWDGSWPAFLDVWSVQIAVQHADNAEQAKRLREYADRDHAWRAASLRHMPAKYFTKKVVDEYQMLTELFARIRGIKAFKPANPDEAFRFSQYEEFLTDDELDAIRKLILATKGTKSDPDLDRDVQFESEALAKRFLGRISDADLCTLWPRFAISAWHAIRALSDTQLVMLFELGNKEDWFRNQGCLTFEVFRRGLMTQSLLEGRLAGFDRRGADLVAEYWCDPLTSGSEFAQSSVEQDVVGYDTVHKNARPFVETLRAWLFKIAPTMVRSDLFQQKRLLLLCAIVWNDEVAKRVLDKWTASKESFKDKNNVVHASEHIADVLTGAPNADAIMIALENAVDGKRMETVFEQAKARLANRRALLTGKEKIEWGRTDTGDALDMIKRFDQPLEVIADGLASDDPVAVLNAWSVAGSLYRGQKSKVEVALSVDQYLAALEKLERIYTPEAPDHAALRKLVGLEGHAAKMFDGGFKAATDADATKRVWNRAGELYRTTKNARYREWIEPYLRWMDESLTEPVAVKLARLAKECAQDPTLTKTVERCVITRSNKAPTQTTVNRLFGEPIGIAPKSWPRSEKSKKKMEHVITLGADVFGPDARKWLGADTAAIGVFVDSIADGFEDAAVVEITADPLQNAKVGAKDTSSNEANRQNGIALDVIRVKVPARVFQGGKKTGPLFELRTVFDRTDLLVPGDGPHFIQEPEGGPDFLFEINGAFAGELNLGDAGRMFVYSETAIAQSH